MEVPKMSARITSELMGLEAFERDYMIFQLSKMEKSHHWNHACPC
jgi:hypothetical protein